METEAVEEPEDIQRSTNPTPGTELQKRALQLRRAGKTYPEIGEILGFRKQRAHAIVKQAEQAEKRGLLSVD